MDEQTRRSGRESIDPATGLAHIVDEAARLSRRSADLLNRSAHELNELLAAVVHVDPSRTSWPLAEGSWWEHVRLAAGLCTTSLDIMATRHESHHIEHLVSDDTLREVLLERRVGVRVLVEEPLPEGDIVRMLDAWGEVARWRQVRPVPVTAVIVDGKEAFLGGVTRDDPRTSAAVRSARGAVVAALGALFDEAWQMAVSLREPGTPSADLGDGARRHAELSALLATGRSDEAVARALGISVRKLALMVHELRDDLGASTRFQLGVEAARRGLI